MVIFFLFDFLIWGNFFLISFFFFSSSFFFFEKE